MPRPPRVAPGGLIYHVLNRAVGRMVMFRRGNETGTQLVFLTRGAPEFTFLSMPRPPRVAPGGLIYHVLNRAVGRMVMFRRDSDLAAFERTMQGK